MTKQDIELIAQTIRDNRDSFKSNNAHAQFAAEFADNLRETNSRFDRGRFILAAMPQAWIGSSKSNVWERHARKATN